MRALRGALGDCVRVHLERRPSALGGAVREGNQVYTEVTLEMHLEVLRDDEAHLQMVIEGAYGVFRWYLLEQ